MHHMHHEMHHDMQHEMQHGGSRTKRKDTKLALPGAFRFIVFSSATAAEKLGESVNGYISKAIDDRMEKDTEKE